jgi:hypothetical protein
VVSLLQVFQLKFCKYFSFPHVCYMPCPSHLPYFIVLIIYILWTIFKCVKNIWNQTLVAHQLVNAVQEDTGHSIWNVHESVCLVKKWHGVYSTLHSMLKFPLCCLIRFQIL